MARMRTYGSLFAVATLAAAVGCANPAPDRPTYSRDIKPLMEAHCIRCHGAGGTLNKDPYSIPIMGVQAPIHGDFTQLADDAAGVHGLTYYTAAGPARVTMTIYLSAPTGPMPPPPAPGLTDTEFTTLTTWLDNPLP
jgi:hypothetical protein